MLKIAACDDESAQLEQMERMLQDYFRARPALPGRISVFSDSRTLLSRVREQGGFDLYILDIIMPGLDGIQTGMELRKMGRRRRNYLPDPHPANTRWTATRRGLFSI